MCVTIAGTESLKRLLGPEGVLGGAWARRRRPRPRAHPPTPECGGPPQPSGPGHARGATGVAGGVDCWSRPMVYCSLCDGILDAFLRPR
jgi:hypothetical protein